ncbi:hypothetical protein C2G38_2093188 [Gigaspora rosea]|uniref:Uncharacterized protein n=1 Tax=Gigaspora rosea TaxID=44941 RepID=A0A397UYY5_9GLOM|nr:hypothetical protein C2G38_2093188 [Gigaspora rosea]
MAFSIDNYDTFNYINSEQEDEINLGISYLKLGHYVDSLDQFNFILDVNSNNLTALILRNFNEALIDFNKALEINPNNAYVLTLSGEVYLKFQLYDKALLCFKIASEFDHSNTESLVHSNNAL